MEFDKINTNNIYIKINKAYQEGIYQDSPLNKKLGRVGMSYKEYYDKTNYQSKEGTGKKNKNEIPENIGDLFFHENIATYKLGNAEISIKRISYEKYKDSHFSLSINNTIINEDLNSNQLSKKIKNLKEEYLETDKVSSEKDTKKALIPLTPEELDKKWGDTGFTYTWYKDDKLIRVWTRQDSTKENPLLNLYVINKEDKKRKNYYNLSLKQANDKLLEFKLNPDIDKPLNQEELNKIDKNLYDEEARKLLSQYKIYFNENGEYSDRNKIFTKFDENGVNVTIKRSPNKNFLFLTLRLGEIKKKYILSAKERGSLYRFVIDLKEDKNKLIKSQKQQIEGVNFNDNGYACIEGKTDYQLYKLLDNGNVRIRNYEKDKTYLLPSKTIDIPKESFEKTLQKFKGHLKQISIPKHMNINSNPNLEEKDIKIEIYK